MVEPNSFINGDCMDYLPEYPDNYFDLAIVDPPYGISFDKKVEKENGKQCGNMKTAKRVYHTADWDHSIPKKEYFQELFRVSKNQIVWGGNYMTEYLPPSRSFVCWDKRIHDDMSNKFADCELAWCNSDLGVARMFRFMWNGMLQGDMKNKEDRFHPTQKPVQLYKWLLSRYAKEGDVILDTHVGSASSLVACREMGFKYVGYEIDKDYYEKAQERLQAAEDQMNIFDFSQYMNPPED